MEADRLQRLQATIQDACEHLYVASQEFVACQRAATARQLTEADQELWVGAWISALALTHKRIIENVEAMNYSVEELTMDEVRQETKKLETWFANVRERNVRRSGDETSPSGESSHETN